jgi:hypothetical protein
MKMTINQIRDVIQAVRWNRNDLTGGTSEEFTRQQVGPILEKKIAELRALVIPARFVRDIERRDEEITFCLRVVGRWVAAQVAGVGTVSDVDAEFIARKMESNRAACTRPQLRVIKGGRA